MSSPTVLLVIDLQECLVSPSPEEGPRSTPSLTTNVTAILRRWRGLQYPLIHVHHHAANPLDPLHPSHPESCAAHGCATPLPSEKVRYKSTGSAFVGTHDGTSLVESIKEDGGKAKLVIVGMEGAQCVNSTTRHAADLGFDVTVVADACASFGTPARNELEGKGRSAQETHDMAMVMLAGGYARVVSTEELLQSLP